MIDFMSMIFHRATVVWASKRSLFRFDGAVVICSPAQALGGLSSSINTARTSLTEQQGIEPGFEFGEPLVLDLEQLRTLLAFEHPFLALERSDLQLFGFLLDVVDGSPVEQLLRRRLRLRQQAPPRLQCGDIFRSG